MKQIRKYHRQMKRDPIGRWLLCIVYAGLGLMTGTIFLLWMINRERPAILKDLGFVTSEKLHSTRIFDMILGVTLMAWASTSLI